MAPRPPRPDATRGLRTTEIGVITLLCVAAGYIVYTFGARVRPEETSTSRDATIESVIEDSRPQIRDCWNRALLTRAPDARDEVRVDATIVVANTGAIDHVTTTGDPPGYPNLAACVESKIRRWHFPRRPQSTTVDVPFMFGGP
jgi:hypothetical protein